MQATASKIRGLIIAAVADLALAAGLRPALATENGEPVAEQSRALIFGTPGEARSALAALEIRGKPDVAPAMILALRYSSISISELSKTLQRLTGHWSILDRVNQYVGVQHVFDHYNESRF